jgi:hypothetical protein
MFQMITLEGWSDLMYNLMDANIPWVAGFYCVILVLVVALGNLNVILAVISEAINDLDKFEDPAINRHREAVNKAIKTANFIKFKKEREEAKKKGILFEERPKELLLGMRRSRTIRINSTLSPKRQSTMFSRFGDRKSIVSQAISPNQRKALVPIGTGILAEEMSSSSSSFSKSS